MDFSRFDEAGRSAAFHADFRAFLDEFLTPAVLASTAPIADHHDRGFFRALGERGYVIPELPVDRGGAGLEFAELEIMETMLRERDAPMVSLGTTRLVYPVIEARAHPAIRDGVLKEIVEGRSTVALGYTEPSGGSDIADARTRAVRESDGSWTINGSKVFTTGAHHASYAFLIALTDPAAPKRQGLTMFLVPLTKEGVQIDALQTLGERSNIVYFGDVRVPDEYRLGDVNDGWAVLSGPLASEHSEGEGGTKRYHIELGRLYGGSLDHAVQASLDWVDSGGPRHPLTVATIGRVLAMAEAAADTQGLEGRVLGAENFIRGTDLLMDAFAPDSLLIDEGLPSKVRELHLRAQASAIVGGTTDVFLNLISRSLGLPRPAYRA